MALLLRSAPKDGYDSIPKWLYRHHVWTAMQIALGGSLPRRGNYALLPSSEGLELDLLQDNGILPDQLYVIDHNPRVVGGIKRRYRGVNTYGMDAFSALLKMSAEGVKLTACNLDLCGQLTNDLLRNLSMLKSLPCWVDGAVVAVTILKGRERYLVKGHNKDAQRLKQLRKAIGTREEVTGQYTNLSGTPFMWAVYKMRQLLLH